MLAATLENTSQLKFPVIVSPKLDGLRCYISGGVAYSRNGKPFRNKFVQSQLKSAYLEGLDGELIVGAPTHGNVLGRTQSGIMSTEGEPDFTFHVFDSVVHGGMPFLSRLMHIESINHRRVASVIHRPVHSIEQFLDYEQAFLKHGFEGIMARHPDLPYKFGRSTLGEGGLIKFKRFTDGEGIVESIEEGVHNLNEAEQDAFGRAKRSTHQENMQPSGRVGTLFVKDLKTNELVQVSPGRMTHDMRRYYWENPHKLVGSIVKYKWFDYGKLDAPRFATFQAMRDESDL